jgi:hypothetical protein
MIRRCYGSISDDAAHLVDVEIHSSGQAACRQRDHHIKMITFSSSLIATQSFPVDSARGYRGVSIHFLDAATGRVVRQSVVLSPDENDPDAPDQLLPEVLARAAAVQRELDAGAFRTLIALGVHDRNPEDSHVDATRIHAGAPGRSSS